MVRIRPMEPEDCQAVYEIDQSCFTDAWSLAVFRDLFRYPTNYYFVGEENEIICGFAGITVSVDTADIMNIAVSKEYRGRGIGRQLLGQLLEQAVRCGCEQMLLEVRESNHPARQLYQSSGFTEIALRTNYYSKPTEHAIIMQRPLRQETKL